MNCSFCGDHAPYPEYYDGRVACGECYCELAYGEIPTRTDVFDDIEDGDGDDDEMNSSFDDAVRLIEEDR